MIARLPSGEVCTYGDVAAMAGRPGAARAVGRILAGSGAAAEPLPWWRVVNAAGRLVPGHEGEQVRRLRAEGIDVDTERGRVRWPRSRGQTKPAVE